MFLFVIKLSFLFFKVVKYLSKFDNSTYKLARTLGDNQLKTITNPANFPELDYEVVKTIDERYVEIYVYPKTDTRVVVILLGIYSIIKSCPELDILGEIKLVLILSSTEGQEKTLAKTFLFSKTTNVDEFITHFLPAIASFNLKGYPLEDSDFYIVKAIPNKMDINSHRKFTRNIKNVTQLRSYSTSSIIRSKNEIITVQCKSTDLAKSLDPRRYILPLKPKKLQDTAIAVIDIETVTFDGRLYPIAIGLYYKKYNKENIKLMYIKETTSLPTAEILLENSNNMIMEMVEYYRTHCKNYTIFAHNLGKFDGILLLKPIYKLLRELNNTKDIGLSILVAKDNSIITIKHDNIKLLDSYRIFPFSLKNMASFFNVPTQKGDFDHESLNINNLHDVSIKSELNDYLIKDLKSLYECMMFASSDLFYNYFINVTDVYSTSSLAMKYFRVAYLPEEGIPTLPKHIENFINEGYYGGISQVYKTRGENLYYYDINSLYPYSMTMKMPYKFLAIKYNVNLNKFFGYAEATIYVPPTLEYKLLPVRNADNLSTPSGYINGVYFSEELKYAESIGCTVKVQKGYEFSAEYIFNKYVDDLYEKKRTAIGPAKVMYKLFLNGLYGYFARRNEVNVAKVMTLDDATNTAQAFLASNIIALDPDVNDVLLVRDSKPNKELCKLTGADYLSALKSSMNDGANVKSNRAIAGAITAYSRIHIHKFKVICGDVYYSDTDSIITSNKLDDKYISDALGMMKDELNGKLISDGIFISPKLYGLKLDNGKEIIKSRGVGKNKLNFDELIRIWKGETITVESKRMFKPITALKIINKTIQIQVKLNIPDGKVPIYKENLIIGFKDQHITLMSTISSIRERLMEVSYNKIKNYFNRLTKKYKKAPASGAFGKKG